MISKGLDKEKPPRRAAGERRINMLIKSDTPIADILDSHENRIRVVEQVVRSMSILLAFWIIHLVLYDLRKGGKHIAE